LGARALRFLEAKLADIKAVVPEERLKKLLSITIVLDLTHGNLRSMQYPPSAGWLKANGYAELREAEPGIFNLLSDIWEPSSKQNIMTEVLWQ